MAIQYRLFEIDLEIKGSLESRSPQNIKKLIGHCTRLPNLLMKYGELIILSDSNLI